MLLRQREDAFVLEHADLPAEQFASVTGQATTLSSFPILMQRVLSGDVLERPTPGTSQRHRMGPAPALTEEEMIALGTPDSTPRRHRRGRSQ